jgi:hypothetical protein
MAATMGPMTNNRHSGHADMGHHRSSEDPRHYLGSPIFFLIIFFKKKKKFRVFLLFRVH